MYKIDERYPRPKVKKIDNITQKLGIDTKNIGFFENFITKDEIEIILQECKKHEPKYDEGHTHGKSLSSQMIDSKILNDFAQKMIPLIAKNAENFYNLEQITDRPFQYTFHPDGTYLDPHTDVIGWEPKHNEKNEYTTQEKYFPYFWSGHLSNIIYLNDDFEGGELFFPDFNFQFRPKPGMLVIFPGNTHYLHGVTKVTGSTRYTCSIWTKFKDFDNTI